jgi:hypothetical protein
MVFHQPKHQNQSKPQEIAAGVAFYYQQNSFKPKNEGTFKNNYFQLKNAYW